MSELWPPITIVIPAYNLQNYIADALESALTQNYAGQVCVIVLDDGSSDNTLAVAQGIAAKNSTVTVYHQLNQGRVGARNRLLQLAETEFVAWLDGDDIAPPVWLHQQYELICSQPDLVAVSGQGYAMTDDRLPIGPIPRPSDPAEIADRHISGQSNAFFQSCTLTKRSAILAAGSYRTKYPAAEDYDLWLRMEHSGRLANSRECHLYYRVHATSANATVGVEQRQQGFLSCNEARLARGMQALEQKQAEDIPPPKKDDWNRKMYWINVALRAGNPRTAAKLTLAGLKVHPMSLWLWLLLFVSISDWILLIGNRTKRFTPGQVASLGSLPGFSMYRIGRWIYYRVRPRRV